MESNSTASEGRHQPLVRPCPYCDGGGSVMVDSVPWGQHEECERCNGDGCLEADEVGHINYEVRAENLLAEVRLKETCRREEITRRAAIRRYGDPRNWPNSQDH
jgi:DnaJ-class molecular chaperone